MVNKLFLIFLVFVFNLANSNIIYDKNNISITDIELNKYVNLYKDNYGYQLEINKAITNIVLMKKTINFLEMNNPNFMSILKENIKLQFGENVFDENILLSFLIFQKIRNEFISEYFTKNFTIKDLELIFQQYQKLSLPISLNNCLTIEKLHEINNDKEFILSFFENVKKNEKIFTTKLDNKKYYVCINNQSYKNLEDAIIDYIKNKTEDNFNKFIYGKLN